MASTKLASLALLLSTLALIYVVLGAPTQSRAYELNSSSKATEYDAKLSFDALSLRIDALQAEVEKLQLRNDSLTSSSRVPADSDEFTAAGDSIRLEAMEERIKGLEELQPRGLNVVARDEPITQLNLDEKAQKQREQMENLRRMVVDWTEQARDSSNPVSVRLRALKSLRGNHLADGTNARVPLIPEMVHLAQTNDQGSTRANVWRHLDGIVDPRLRTALLDALATDLYPDAREVAADSLQHYLPDSTVEAALRYAMKYDGDEAVQKQAEESIESQAE